MAGSVHSMFLVGFVVLGLVLGFGMIFVRPAPGEPEKAAKIVPWGIMYRYKLFRYFVALVGFVFAFLGIAGLVDWIQFG